MCLHSFFVEEISFLVHVTTQFYVKITNADDLETIRNLLAFDYKSGLPWKVNPNTSKINLQDAEYDCSLYPTSDTTFMRSKPCAYYEPFSQLSGVFWYWDNSVKSRNWSLFFNVSFDYMIFSREKWYKSAVDIDKLIFENFNE
ncbi:uncharacterized protein [Chelonus insularis]|uniref:uncharacterized protein n=1 Tax=Chelonus insularis TaxID=460826 RepID=UPI00158F0D4D|nr:uncharacterized protein LOC118070749 [Chelonus insularis]